MGDLYRDGCFHREMCIRDRTYTIELEIRRNGVDVSECYAPIEAVRFIVYRGMETPVVYLTAESQNGGFGDTKDRGACLLYTSKDAEAAIEKASKAVAVLEDEAVKALTGEARLDLSIINQQMCIRDSSMTSWTT